MVDFSLKPNLAASRLFFSDVVIACIVVVDELLNEFSFS